MSYRLDAVEVVPYCVQFSSSLSTSSSNLLFRIGDGSRNHFWTDPWCGSSALNLSFPTLVDVAVNKNETVAEV